MAEWNVTLPVAAVEGAATHVADHNLIVDAVKEVRTNVDGIELTPGPKGDKGEPGAAGKDGSDAANPFTEEEVAALKALVEGTP